MSNILPIRILYEDWGEAMLPGGVVLRYRPVLTMVLDEGEGKWGFRFQPQYQVYAPESLRRPTHATTKRLGPMDPIINQGQAHTSYEVDGKTLHLTLKLKRVYRTDGYDQSGEPVLHMDQDIEMKVLSSTETPAAQASA